MVEWTNIEKARILDLQLKSGSSSQDLLGCDIM